MDFAGTRGDDGITPHIGENGNWFIGDEDTGERALGVTYDDLTPEQIEELQRPATEAATEANKAAQAAKNATESATTATEGAVAAAAMANTATGAATTATTAANNAAAEATAAAGNATTAATEADDAATAANAAAASATGAATAANDAAGAANAAAEDATHAAESVGTAAEDAASAAKAANAATEAATTATTAANNAAAEATAATGNATTAATEATNAANAANIAAEGIDGKIAGKADLDPATGFVKSSQIAPLQGRQTGVKTGNGCFFSDDAQLLIDGNKTFSVVFSHNEYTKGAIHLLFSDHDYSTLSKGIYLYTIDDYVYLVFCGKYLLNDKIETGKVYQVIVTVDKQGEAVGYLNSIARNRTSDFAAYTAPVGFRWAG